MWASLEVWHQKNVEYYVTAVLYYPASFIYYCMVNLVCSNCMYMNRPCVNEEVCMCADSFNTVVKHTAIE